MSRSRTLFLSSLILLIAALAGPIGEPASLPQHGPDVYVHRESASPPEARPSSADKPATSSSDLNAGAPDLRIGPGHEVFIASLVRDPADVLVAHELRNIRATANSVLVEITGASPGTLVLTGSPLDRPVIHRSRSFLIYWDGPSPVPGDVETFARAIAGRDQGDFWQRVAPSESGRPTSTQRETVTDSITVVRWLEVAVALGAMLVACVFRFAGRGPAESRATLLRLRWGIVLFPIAAGVLVARSDSLSFASLSEFRIDLLGHFPAGQGLWVLALVPGAVALLLACGQSPGVGSTANLPAGYESDARSRLAVLILRLLAGCAVAAVVLGLFAARGLPDSRSVSTTASYLSYVGAHGAVLVAAWRILGSTRYSYLAIALLGIFNFGANLTLEPLHLGDSLELRHSTFQQLPRSELLSSALHSGFRQLWGTLDYTAPLFGALSLATVFWVSAAAARSEKTGSSFPYFVTALYIASPLPVMFLRGYVENAQLAMFPAMLGVSLLSEGYSDGRYPLGYKAIAALCLLGLAGLIHGWAVALWGLVIVVPATNLLSRPVDWARIALESIVGTGVLFAVAWVAVALLLSLGLGFKTGNLLGGSDGCALVHWQPDACSEQRYPLVSIGHALDWARVVSFAFPAWIVVSLLTFGRQPVDPRPVVIVGTAVGCYLIFVFLWNFDLGFPSDLDLMFSGAGLLVLFTAALLSRREAFFGISWSLRLALLALCLLAGTMVVPTLLATDALKVQAIGMPP